VHKLLEEGRVLLDGRVPRKSEALAAGQTVEVEVPEPVALALEPEALPLTIVYEDASCWSWTRRRGWWCTLAGTPGGTLVNALLHHVRDLAGIGGALRPGIVHRLDKGTSGLMVVAKSDTAHQRLSDALKRRGSGASTRPRCGATSRTTRSCDRRPDRSRSLGSQADGGGRGGEARGHARARPRALALAELLDVALETGRTHQIRVHLAHRGHPVVGDPLYGPLWERGMGSRPGLGRELSRQLARPSCTRPSWCSIIRKPGRGCASIRTFRRTWPRPRRGPGARAARGFLHLGGRRYFSAPDQAGRARPAKE
jgi:23S rRNA pseudouridine1911/1915/1917 synthase